MFGDERLQRRLRQVNFQKKDPAAADALRTLKGTLDMDNVPHLSGYDRNVSAFHSSVTAIIRTAGTSAS